MSDGPVTLSRVAREAGVSLATASRAINGSATRTVRPELRDRVMAAARRLGYVPDPSAQAMARGRTAALGLVVHDIADPYFSAIASGVTRAAEAEGLIVTLASTQLRPERERAFVELVRRQRGRAVILAGSRMVSDDGAGAPAPDTESERVAGPAEALVGTAAGQDLESILTAFRESGGGVATIGQAIGSLPVVEIDNSGGAAALARELHGLGYQRFGILSGPSGLRTAADRTSGFRDALASLGNGVRDDDVVPGEFTRDGGYAAMTELIARSGRARAGSAADVAGTDAPRGDDAATDDGTGQGSHLAGADPDNASLPEVVFAVNDVMAVGAMAAVRDAGLSVPDDVAVAGFDDIPTLRDVTPALTTVHIALERIGEAATKLALGEPTGLEATAEPDPDATDGLEATAPGSVTVHGEVVLRASTPRRPAD
ncbi:LacI family DNA-binding transcriptional regulator [Myceligenerans pegani]|uniref:LacI family DNA-binding transcriptional regulator n=1 Tax=Myceligenerans pegani TaxID=2776917 RepID=A0ABR9N4Y1_9MICO|nr:LacI family DNA-binding transcriptional regulator [Myceligenerans sp. TRM 65318]MBE1878729.1 LacI family DNA-binding transcriptional regulator [Myceligenerans sp. TRM 65318]MBE3021000.1 LacI family DNA-binding transcriptional regulator [Myceligenerans sp. TRM 65318]